MVSESQLAKNQTVWAVVRYEAYERVGVEDQISIREVLPTSEEADAEAARLNQLKAEGKTRYFVKGAKYFPEGRGAKADY